MPVQTLLKMAQAAAVRVSSQIDNVSHMPYHLVRPILSKIQNPDQLREIETKSPHIAEADSELWQAFIARDIPDWKNKLDMLLKGQRAPNNPSNWHKVYYKLQRNEAKKAAADEEALRKTLQGESLRKATNETLFVQKVLPHKREINTGIVDGVAKSSHSGWNFNRNPTLKNAKSGKDMMAAIRRQTANAAKVKSHTQPFMRPTPAQQLNQAKRQITTAPPSMVNEAVRNNKPLAIAPRDLLPHEQAMVREQKAAREIGRIIPPRRANTQAAARDQAVEAAARTARAEKEERLRAFTQGRPQTRTPGQSPHASNAASPPATPSVEHAASPAATGGTPKANPRSASPETSPGTKVIKKRPIASSIFAPAKKRKT